MVHQYDMKVKGKKGKSLKQNILQSGEPSLEKNL